MNANDTAGELHSLEASLVVMPRQHHICRRVEAEAASGGMCAASAIETRLNADREATIFAW